MANCWLKLHHFNVYISDSFLSLSLFFLFFFVSNQKKLQGTINFTLMTETNRLECTDAAGRVPHPSLTQRDAGRGVRRSWPRVGAASAFFFFFFSDSHRLGSIRADAARFAPNRLRFAPNRADSARIGSYRPYRSISAGNQYGRYGWNRPESAETGRNRPWKSPERPKF